LLRRHGQAVGAARCDPEKTRQKHLSDGTLVLYDITSAYMEGEYNDSELVEFGYNRDQKRGHEQIVISLL